MSFLSDLLRFLFDRPAEYDSVVKGYRVLLEEVNRMWETYEQWITEVEGYFGHLNSQVCMERYRNTTLHPCEPHTPFVRDTALLAFRNSFILNWEVLGKLKRAVEGDDQVEAGRGQLKEQPAEAKPKGLVDFTSEELESDEVMEFSIKSTGLENAALSGGSNVMGKAKRHGAFAGRGRNIRILDNLSDELTRLCTMAEELDLPDDHLSRSVKTQGYFRRELLIPLR